MKAYRIHEYGDAAKFIEDEVNKPSAKKGHVVVKCCDHPISIGPNFAIVVDVHAVRVAIACGIEPITSTMFARMF